MLQEQDGEKTQQEFKGRNWLENEALKEHK